MFIPYNTDAPLYHFPYTTICLIAANTLAFFISMSAEDVMQVVPWTLEFGQGLHPMQWVSNNFLHADIVHLIGNMFFLWGFGLVVEGKLGWWRFLALYLAIGAIYGAIIQVAMLGAEEGLALGASGVIFGIMVVALVWAPKNEMNCFIWLIGPRFFDVPITVFAATYLIFQIVVATISGFSMSSEMLHLTGAGVGAVFGVALLKLDLVDCEGWDIFALWAGRLGARPELAAIEERPAVIIQPPSDDLAQFLTQALKNRLAAGDAAGAATLYERQRNAHGDWRLTEADLMGLIKALHKQQLWSPSVRPMADYLRQFPSNSTRVRLKLAQILTDVERRPAKALKVLSKVEPAHLPAELQPIHQKLTAKAHQLLDEAEIEVGDGEDW